MLVYSVDGNFNVNDKTTKNYNNKLKERKINIKNTNQDQYCFEKPGEYVYIIFIYVYLILVIFKVKRGVVQIMNELYKLKKTNNSSFCSLIYIRL